jgi:hypothetical protein
LPADTIFGPTVVSSWLWPFCGTPWSGNWNVPSLAGMKTGMSVVLSRLPNRTRTFDCASASATKRWVFSSANALTTPGLSLLSSVTMLQVSQIWLSASVSTKPITFSDLASRSARCCWVK